MTVTITDLDRYIELLSLGGIEPQEAIDMIWPEPEPAPEPKAPKKPTMMLTEFPDGVVIGWDFCAALNGGCGKTVSKCECKTGPHALKVFELWRTGEKAMPNYAATSAPTTTVAKAITAKAPAVHPDGQVVCREHNDFVDHSEAEKNDDGTWTCFVCQESGAQQGVQVDG